MEFRGFSKRRVFSLLFIGGIVLLFLFLLTHTSFAQERLPEIKLPDIKIGTKTLKDGNEISAFIYLIFGLTIMSLAPYILIMATAFIRVTIVLSFVRTALGTQQVPPTQVLMGLALFITFYIMAPVGEEIHKQALVPLMKQEIKVQDFAPRAAKPLKKFLLKQTRDKDLKLFVKLARKSTSEFKNRSEVPLYILLPAYIISEIKTAFEIGFVIYLPFLVIDMVVASVLMSMGMFMLSPMQISMPFKLLLFVMIDGWNLIVENLVKSFQM